MAGSTARWAPPRRQLAASALLFETELLARTSTPGIKAQGYSSPACGGGACGYLNSVAPWRYLELTLPGVPPGTYDITIRYCWAAIRGACRVSAAGTLRFWH